MRADTEGSRLETTTEIARTLRVHPKHVYRLLRAGLPALRVGGEWRFDPAEVRRWAARRGRAVPAAERAPIVAANDDEAVAILLAALADGGGPLLGSVRADSGAALRLVADGRAAVAGYHRRDVPHLAGGRRLARIRLVEREIGLVGPRRRAAPRLHACDGRPLASRPESSGTRSLLDEALAGAGLSSRDAHARATCHGSHRDVVFAVARGDADVGVASRDWAERAGLPFRAIGLETYELLVPTDVLGSPALLRLCEAAASAKVRARVGALPGHSAEGSGTIRTDAPEAGAPPPTRERARTATPPHRKPA